MFLNDWNLIIFHYFFFVLDITIVGWGAQMWVLMEAAKKAETELVKMNLKVKRK